MAKAYSNNRTPYPVSLCPLRLLLGSPEKVRKQNFLSYIYLHSLQRVYKLFWKQTNLSHGPQLLTGSPGLVNEACVGSIGVSLLVLFWLVWTESSRNGNRLEICIAKGIVCVQHPVQVHHLWSLAFFQSQISALQHPHDCCFGPFLQFRCSFYKKYLLTVHREYRTPEFSLAALLFPVCLVPVSAQNISQLI